MFGDTTELRLVKKRIMGVLLRDARESSGHTVAECAAILGIGEEQYQTFEAGEKSLTFPQLEMLAYFFNVPIRHFWGTETVSTARQEEEIKGRVPELLTLRQRLLGGKLRQLREQANLTQAEVAERADLSPGQVELAEQGQLDLPLTALEKLVRAMQFRLDDLVEGHGPIGNWIQAQEQFKAFTELPPELREFVVKPINRSYLDLAIRLSRLEVGRLRGIAESILEITY